MDFDFIKIRNNEEKWNFEDFWNSNPTGNYNSYRLQRENSAGIRVSQRSYLNRTDLSGGNDPS